MLGLTKRRLLLIAVPIIALLGISQTNIPSGGMDILNSAGDAVIQFFDTGDVLVTGTLDADVYEQDGVVYDLSAMGAGAKHTIKDEGTSRTARTNINFIGPTVAATDNSGADSTDVTINAVAGPGSSTDNTLPRFDSTTGKIIQSSGIVVDDSNNVSGVGTLDLGTPLAVADGGTGVATLADAGVVVGNGTGVVQVTDAGTSGQVLTSNGTGVDPTFQSFPGGGDALTTNPLDQFASTTSAEFSGVITDETGTGLVVLGTSPTLTTPNLGTPSVLTLTNATGLPVAGGGTGASTLTDAGVLIGNGTGVVQATSAGTSGQVLTSNGIGVDPTFQTVAGAGDVAGPASATDNALSRFDGTTGKTIQNSAATLDDSGNLTATSFIGSGASLTGLGDVDGPGSSTDNTLPRFDSTTGKIIQGSGVVVDDSNNMSGVATLDLTTPLAVAEGGSGAATFTDGGVLIGNGTSALQATSAGTSGQVLTSNGTGVDPTFQTITGGDPTYGSEAAATDDAVFVDENNWLGLGILNPVGPVHIYSATAAPRIYYEYFDDAVTNTGWVIANAGANVDYGGSVDWTSPGSVTADDGTDATSAPGSHDDSDYLRATFDLSALIPSGATINGVEARYQVSQSASGPEENQVFLVVGGAAVGTDQGVNGVYTGTPTNYDNGGASNLWGTTITRAQAVAADFGFQFGTQDSDTGSETTYCDAMWIKVYYTPATSYTWSGGIDISDEAFTLRAGSTDQMRMAYATGDTEFTGDVTAAAFIGDGSGLTGISSGDVDGPASSTDNALARFDSTTGKLLQNSTVYVGDTGNFTGMGTLNTHTIPGGTGTLALTTDITVTPTSSNTLTNKRVQVHYALDNSSPVDIAYGADQAMVTELAANTTINAPTGTPVFGETLIYYIKQGAGPYTVTWNAVFKSGTDWGLAGAIPAMTTTNALWDYFLFVWNNAESEWHLLACSQGN